jgi:hypothetical protein
MISRVLGDVACQLGDLDFLLQVSLETREEHFPLGGFQPVHEMGQRALIICESPNIGEIGSYSVKWGSDGVNTQVEGDSFSNITQHIIAHSAIQTYLHVRRGLTPC